MPICNTVAPPLDRGTHRWEPGPIHRSSIGIVGNDWILVKESGMGQYCAAGGGEFKLTGLESHMAGATSRSPWILQVETLGDRMKEHFGPKCHVWGTKR
ncbi:MAG: hypothetical protein R3E58_11630 [Phycisphaerae bacterium]